jgi:hypothetical protein
MSIPNRQIGWSQESNLLSYISKQLEKLNGTVAATAAGGLLNPTTNYIPFNSGLAFGDSYLFNDTDILKTVWNTTDKGLKLDFLNEQYTLGRESTEYLRVQTELIYTNYGGNDVGLKLDFANNLFFFGDFINNLTSYLIVNGSEVAVETQSFGVSGFKADGQIASAWLGDFNGNANNTFLILDDVLQRLELSGNLEALTAGASSGKFLKITIGGVDYKIALLNNA